jgi:D-glycero-alpha-D-manno-heptose-7-phosphate kinase
VAGAGGGGYLLLYCPRAKQDAVRAALSGLPELPFHLERDGSKVIFNYRR